MDGGPVVELGWSRSRGELLKVAVNELRLQIDRIVVRQNGHLEAFSQFGRYNVF